MVLSINSLLGALVSAALDLGAAGVAVVRGARALGDVHLVVARHDETEAPLRVDGRHLHGPRSMVYVRELIQMMQRCPFSEWAVRADWMARLLPLEQLQGQRPAESVLEFTISAADFGSSAEMGRLQETFGAVFGPFEITVPHRAEASRVPRREPLPRSYFEGRYLSLAPTEEDLHEIALEEQLADVLEKLRDYAFSSPPAAFAAWSDLAFLALYLAISGDHMRDVARLMVRGGLSTLMVARIFRTVFVIHEP